VAVAVVAVVDDGSAESSLLLPEQPQRVARQSPKVSVPME